jgi:GDP-L-fucose synthase
LWLGRKSEKAAMTEEPKIPLFDLGHKSVYVAGHTGMVGSALVRRLKAERCRILTVDHAVVDLTSQTETEHWIGEAKPDAVIIAAAKVGGIAYNNAYPVDFLFDNLAIALNVIRASYRAGVKKLLFLGSSCIYPRAAPQPMREDMLLTGPLEPTNQWYAVAKIAGIKLIEAYRRQYGARSCRPICTARATTTIPNTATCRRGSFAECTKLKHPAHQP